MTKTCNTCCECAANICIYQCQFSCLVEVFVVHVVDEVKCVDVNTNQPFHHIYETGHEFFVSYHVAKYRTQSRTALFAGLRVYTATDSVCKTFSQVGTCTEELHLLTCLCGRNATADGVVVAPNRTHHVVVFILNGACFHRYS